MSVKSVTRLSLLTAYLAVCFSGILYAQALNRSFQYTSPLPGAELVSRQSVIILRPGETLLSGIHEIASLATIVGSESGNHSFDVVIADDEKTINIKPHFPFEPGETVTFNLETGLRTVANGYNDLSFGFKISPGEIFLPADFYDSMDLAYDGYSGESIQRNSDSDSPPRVANVSIPPDFPLLTVTISDDPHPGYIYFCDKSGNPSYLMILDNSGYPVFYRRFSASLLDFKIQPTGLLTYFNFQGNKYYVLDSTYTLIDSIECQNGYSTDQHGIQQTEDHHSLLMSYDPQPVDMSEIVEGGDPNATVVGLVIQELDSLKNVIFQWRSWDHYEITDAVGEDLTAPLISYVHGNAVEYDYDDNILISARRMNEITKIDHETGDIIWRFGSHAVNNQFTFVDDATGFSRQHDMRRLPNGNITIFDNGHHRDPQSSRAVEYEMDEINMIATRVWDFYHDPSLWARGRGNAQRLPDGNTIINWGNNGVISEVRPDNTTSFELVFEDGTSGYRAFRFPWQGKAAIPYLIAIADAEMVHLYFNKFGDGDVIEYNIYMGEAPNPTDLAATTSNTYLDILDLVPGTTYYFRVTAVDNEQNESPFSNEVDATPFTGVDCSYIPGDVNHNNVPFELNDVVVMIGSYNGTLPPAYLCDCSANPPVVNFAATADPNGNCVPFELADVVTEIGAFRGSATVSGCSDCPGSD